MTPSETRRARPRAILDPARQVAFSALRSVDVDDSYLNLVLPRLISSAALGSRDAAFATELTNGTKRMQGAYDPVLDDCVTGGVASLQPDVLTALRLGTHQLLGMRVSSHAAVTTTVELVRSQAGERPVRLVNAVLRRVATRSLDEWVAVVAPPSETDLAGHLAVRYSHPRWIVEVFLDVLGADEAAAALAADNTAAPVTLAVRPGLATVDELLEYGARPAQWSPYAAVAPAGDPGVIPLLRDGRAGVQDEGSQLAALAVARAAVSGRDDRWLDACAGPGGKAALLSGIAAERAATLVAAELQPHRARLVRQAVRGYLRATVVAADGMRPPWPAGSFDRVLVDAPCTGLGALRRRPDARWRRRPSDLDSLVPLQIALLRAALTATRRGGVVTYVTCSPHPAETRAVLDVALRDGGAVEEDARPLLGIPDVGVGPHVQLWPHLHGTDAMFVSVLRRTA